MDYNKTLQLPKTDFPMRAGLPKREPDQLRRWQEQDLYGLVLQKNEDRPLFILHDGPPYANGDVHMGTALNKVLKDFIVRHKSMTGWKTPYVPGWDTHGLPIESQIIKQFKLDRETMSIPEFRDKCRDFALRYLDSQREQFKRLGGIADWDHPYITLKPAFEARQIEVFGEMAAKGYIYRGMKPVYWCAHDRTALAEAEIEYRDDPCESVYVKFRVKDGKGLLDEEASFVIWTTTTWTLPGNVAICLHPDLDYALIRAGDETLVAAQALAGNVAPEHTVLRTFKGRELEHITTQHPFLDRESLIILGDHVTAESGTGCVHTAPGHGAEDFVACKPYHLPVLVPVDSRGMMTAEAGASAGLFCEKAGPVILDELRQKGALLKTEHILHSYPHCWRCKQPVVYRATKQWFASVEAIKEDTERAIREVQWYPAWGRERMSAMVRERADWCISRQRNWGVPIPIFYCEKCENPLINADTIRSVADWFAKEGSNAWHTHTAEELLPAGTVCPECGHGRFTKETDIMDVWFDSGSSHVAVLEDTPGLRWPSDMYLEGHDQFRGWYQSSLLTSVATRGCAPYRQIVSHGWVVDGSGRKMSKSEGNTVLPGEVIGKYGADILRLWVSSSDYHGDIRVSDELFKQLSEVYLKIRNTARFLLGNVSDFDPNTPLEQYEDLDRWALHRLKQLTEKVLAAYERYEYHVIFHAIHNFCVVDLSNFYLDVVKDRLYCERPDSPIRRSAQSAMYRILDALTRLLAPILAFTAEEIWTHMRHPDHGVDSRSVQLNDMPRFEENFLSEDEEKQWEKRIALRDEVNKALELARAEKKIGKPLEAKVILDTDEDPALLAALFIVSQVEARPGADMTIERAEGEKCLRCWGYFTTLGSHPDHPQLCPRCTQCVV